jgi:serine/threonine protein kinase
MGVRVCTGDLAMNSPNSTVEPAGSPVDPSTIAEEGSAPAPPRNAIEEPGQIISGRYRLEAHLAGGAMGSIWRACHLQLKARVALKFLDASAARSVELHSRFLQEARAAAAVRSAHVVHVFDYGIEAGTPYIVMELLEGESLEQRLAQRGPISPAELATIFDEAARAVSLCHEMGVVHRDLKPGNILIASEGPHEVTKLIDFGIAKVDPDRLAFTQPPGTQAGTVIGTPNYMSPEQLRGSSVDKRVDLWALGIIAFECLTGRTPFEAQSVGDLIVQICTEDPAVPSRVASVPAGFDRWFARATHRELDCRFDSAEEMAASLSAILRAASPAPPLRRDSRALARLAPFPRSRRSKRVVAVGLAAAACAMAGVLAWSTPEPEEAPALAVTPLTLAASDSPATAAATPSVAAVEISPLQPQEPQTLRVSLQPGRPQTSPSAADPGAERSVAEELARRTSPGPLKKSAVLPPGPEADQPRAQRDRRESSGRVTSAAPRRPPPPLELNMKLTQKADDDLFAERQ